MARKGYNFDFSCISSRPAREKEQTPVWCDFIELLCMVEYSGFLSRGEVLDVVFGEGKGVAITDEDESDEDDDSPDVNASVITQLSTMGSRNGQRSDKSELFVSEWFANLASREEILGELYPFEANNSEGTLKLKQALSDSHKIYLFFLLASNLRVFSKKLELKITSDFENVCLEAQKIIFPLLENITGIEMQTHLFGKNPVNQGRFSGTFAEKFTKLAELIQARDVDVSFFRPNNSGDGGIDLISVAKIDNDIAFGLPLILSQCACSYDDWKTKQGDHHRENYLQMRLFDVEYLRLIFIPFFYRNQNGHWFDIHKIKISIIDRLRLMKILVTKPQSIIPLISSWTELILTTDSGTRQSLANTIARS